MNETIGISANFIVKKTLILHDSN